MSLQFVFVHGFAGWGSYDERYRKLPYWGMRGGDLIAWLRGEGFAAYAASVSPKGSAWDRACELYAQIAGTRVDYGAAHSRAFGHERYGRDFSGRPLLPRWDEDVQLALIGHSFGGVTARLFAHLMEHGDAAEREAPAGDGISPLFQGGMGSRIHSIVAVASSLNGNSTYTMLEDPAFDPDRTKVSWKGRFFGWVFDQFTQKQTDSLDPRDCAERDMEIDRAQEMNRGLRNLPWVYHYSIPCSLTRKQADGTHVPENGMESVFLRRSAQMGCYSGVTKGGFTIDDAWWQNDGRVSTISEIAPFGSAQKNLKPGDLPEPGLWNVYPLYHGDHMSLQGGLRHTMNIRPFYRDLLSRIGQVF